LRSLGAAFGVLFLVLGGCGAAAVPKPLAHPSQPLHLLPLVDLAPAASLVWLVELHPRALALEGRLSGPLARLFPEQRLSALAQAYGGVDLRETDALVAAGYRSTTLLLAHQFVQPGRIEKAFAARVAAVEGRAVEGPPDPATSIIRVWGATGTDREQVAIFGFDAVGMERGRFGPLRASMLFAQGKLRRASPALHAPPLAHVAELLGEAPVRAFAPGPFEGDLKQSMGGLLGASTAVGASARVVESGGEGLAFHGILLGAWGNDAEAAALRLRAVFDVLASSGIGRLLGLGHCLAGPEVHGTAEAITLDFTLDAQVLADALRSATSAEVLEIMGQ
jgi:hypothetical protein